jgi:hypothetical protein
MSSGYRVVAAGAAALLLTSAARATPGAPPVHGRSATASHGRSIPCSLTRPCAHARGRLRTPAPSETPAAYGGELTPLRASGAPTGASAWPAHGSPAARLPQGAFPPASAGAQVPRVRLSAGQLPLDHGPSSASQGDVRRSLGDILYGGADAKPTFSTTTGWLALLLGLIGLLAVLPRPGPQRVRSWATAIPSRAAARPPPHGGQAMLDDARRSEAPGPRWRQGHFVRTPRRRFGASLATRPSSG